MKILQFTCLPDPPATKLKELILNQINIWSRLKKLASDADYVTEAFGPDIWHQHTTNAGLWWFDYGSVYEHIGDDGRLIADQMLGDKPLQGILRNSPLVQAMPETVISIVEVADLYESGYLPQPDNNTF